MDDSTTDDSTIDDSTTGDSTTDDSTPGEPPWKRYTHLFKAEDFWDGEKEVDRLAELHYVGRQIDRALWGPLPKPLPPRRADQRKLLWDPWRELLGVKPIPIPDPESRDGVLARAAAICYFYKMDVNLDIVQQVLAAEENSPEAQALSARILFLTERFRHVPWCFDVNDDLSAEEKDMNADLSEENEDLYLMCKQLRIGFETKIWASDLFINFVSPSI